MQQILAGLLYKKTVIWTDLKINPGASRDNDVIYAGQKVVDAKQRIDDFMQQQNYLPSRYNYVPIDHEEQGVFTSSQGLDSDNQGNQGTDFTQLLDAVVDSHTDMETLIKDKFLFSQEKILGFLETNPVQLTLREEVEHLYNHITNL